MHRKLGIRVTIISSAMLVAVATSWAQQASPVRIRGTIESVQDPTYTIKARDGSEVQLILPEKRLDFGKQPQDKTMIRAIPIKNGGLSVLNIDSVTPS